jgi:DNA-binding NarL/FixJ family response regulator
VGYLLKDRVSDLASFGADIRKIGRRETVIDPELVTRLFARRRQLDPLERLTERERGVLALMARGLTNGAIADELHLAVKTVEAHITAIFSKLELVADDREHRRVLAVLSFLRT